MAVKPVSEQDREHMRRIGEAKAKSHADALARHLALPISERILRSLTWTIEAQATWKWPVNGDGPTELRNRAKRLGMLRA